LKIRCKNQLKIAETIDFITPGSEISTEIVEITDEYGEKKEVANTNDVVYIKLNVKNIPDDWQTGIIRQKDKKHNGNTIEAHLCG